MRPMRRMDCRNRPLSRSGSGPLPVPPACHRPSTSKAVRMLPVHRVSARCQFPDDVAMLSNVNVLRSGYTHDLPTGSAPRSSTATLSICRQKVLFLRLRLDNAVTTMLEQREACLARVRRNRNFSWKLVHIATGVAGIAASRDMLATMSCRARAIFVYSWG